MASEWYMEKVTTDKLEGLLNSYADRGGDPYHIQFMGGRDWVVLFEVQSTGVAVRSAITPGPGRLGEKD